MLSILPSTIAFQLQMAILYFFFSSITKVRKNHLLSIIIGIAVFEAAAVINVVFSNTIWINFLVAFLSNLLFAYLCFRIDLHIAAIYAVILLVLYTAVEFATIFSFSSVFGNTRDYNSDLSVLVINGAVCKTLFFLICLILSQLIRNKRTDFRYPMSFYVFPSVTALCLLVFWFICTNPSVSSKERLLLACISIVLFATNFFLFLTYTRHLEKDIEYIRIKSENDELLKEHSYYNILEHQNQELLRYAHDAKNHLSAIRLLNQDPQIDHYLNALSEQLERYANNSHSGNKMLDVIIDKYVTECELQGISFSYDVRTYNLSAVEDIDLVAILGNLLDNAVSAAADSQMKTISLETAIRNSFGVLIITNSCDAPPRYEHNILVTTKDEARLHGFGMKSVRRVLKKYDGEMRWEYSREDRQFVMTVMLDKQGLTAYGTPKKD